MLTTRYTLRIGGSLKTSSKVWRIVGIETLERQHAVYEMPTGNTSVHKDVFLGKTPEFLKKSSGSGTTDNIVTGGLYTCLCIFNMGVYDK